MDRTMRRCGMAAFMFVTSLSAAGAAEPGFYVGATASRVDHELAKNVSIDPPILIFVPPPSGGFFPVLPPSFGGVVGIITDAFVPLSAADRVEVDDVDAGWSATLGYRINQYLAAEVSYVDFGEASLTAHYPIATVSSLGEITRSVNVSVSGPAASVLGSYPLGANWQVFARAGVLFADQEIDAAATFRLGSTTSTSRREGSFSNEVVMAGVGVEWAFAPRWAARLEYQRTDDLQENSITDESRIDQVSVSVLFNL